VFAGENEESKKSAIEALKEALTTWLSFIEKRM
jgi:hypothetical protein